MFFFLVIKDNNRFCAACQESLARHGEQSPLFRWWWGSGGGGWRWWRQRCDNQIGEADACYCCGTLLTGHHVGAGGHGGSGARSRA